jgi:Tol biopolymer transport system component
MKPRHDGRGAGGIFRLAGFVLAAGVPVLWNACGGDGALGPGEILPFNWYFDDWEPAWSPDGSRIAVRSNRHNDRSLTDHDVYLLDTLGYAVRLTQGLEAGSHDWSPDGTRIAVSSLRTIWVVDVDGSGPTELLAHDEYVGGLAWSPAGGTIAFHGSAGRDDPVDISAYDVVTGTVTQLTGPGNSQLSWSPDGSQAVFTSFPGGSVQIRRMDADGSNVVVLVEGENVFEPAWSPCGDVIAFSETIAPRTHQLKLMDPDGSNVRVVTLGEQAAWSPDCTRLAFIREFVDEYGYDGIDVWVIGVDGAGERKLTQR